MPDGRTFEKLQATVDALCDFSTPGQEEGAVWRVTTSDTGDGEEQAMLVCDEHKYTAFS